MENIITPGPSATLDLSRDLIPGDHLAIALANAALDPDGQVYPWRAGYPLVGSTVVWEGQLWTCQSRERGPGENEPTAMIRLDGQGHDGRAIATRDDLRPVTWSAGDEIALELARATLS